MEQQSPHFLSASGPTTANSRQKGPKGSTNSEMDHRQVFHQQSLLEVTEEEPALSQSGVISAFAELKWDCAQ